MDRVLCTKRMLCVKMLKVVKTELTFVIFACMSAVHITKDPTNIL